MAAYFMVSCPRGLEVFVRRKQVRGSETSVIPASEVRQLQEGKKVINGRCGPGSGELAVPDGDDDLPGMANHVIRTRSSPDGDHTMTQLVIPRQRRLPRGARGWIGLSWIRANPSVVEERHRRKT